MPAIGLQGFLIDSRKDIVMLMSQELPNCQASEPMVRANPVSGKSTSEMALGRRPKFANARIKVHFAP